MKFIRETFFNIICRNKFPYSRIFIAKFDSLYFFLLMMENGQRNTSNDSCSGSIRSALPCRRFGTNYLYNN